MTKAEHKRRHEQLHRDLDELFADYIYHHPGEANFLDVPYKKLMEWSFEQTKNPTPYKP
jgi:hypothetical protein